MSSFRSDIINEAITELGQPISASVDDDNRSTVVSLRTLYRQRARVLLSKYLWNFAKKVEQLSSPVGTPIGWDFQFSRPAGCLRIIKVCNQADMDRRPDLPHEERGGLIYTNSEETWLAYIDATFAEEGSGSWPEIVKHALAMDLASRVAPGLDVGAQRRQELRQLAYMAETEARRWDAQQNKVDRPGLSAWQRNHIRGGARNHGL